MDGKHVLIVGADPTGGRTTQDLISKDYTVSAVADAQEAVQFIEHHRPLVVFVNLPSREAVRAVAHAFRQGGIELPLVLVRQNEDSRSWAEEVGAAAFAPHPARLEGGICENLDAD